MLGPRNDDIYSLGPRAGFGCPQSALRPNRSRRALRATFVDTISPLILYHSANTASLPTCSAVSLLIDPFTFAVCSPFICGTCGLRTIAASLIKENLSDYSHLRVYDDDEPSTALLHRPSASLTLFTVPSGQHRYYGRSHVCILQPFTRCYSIKSALETALNHNAPQCPSHMLHLWPAIQSRGKHQYRRQYLGQCLARWI